MAHPALTHDEAVERAALVAVAAYDIALDLTTSDVTFASTTTVTFTCTRPGSTTWIDLVAPRVVSATLNGEPLDVAGYTGQRLPLPGLAAENTLVVVAECAYSRSGEGLHRLVDPVDDEVYLYSQFEMADAQRVYACFDQPDLKSVFTLHVTAPEHWQVVSNTATPLSSPVRAGVARWDFDTTMPMSTYITALVAGPYHVVRDEYAGPHGTYPLGVFCRSSMSPHLDAERILEETKQGFAFFEEAFGHPYPFGKYDQLFVPEYNAGAMENAGCVTIMEDYIFRSRVTEAAYESRANTILHELAHMWFGDLVTMRWWDDLWLNESFAEWASYHAMARATRYTEAWTSFGNLRKTWAYRQDQLPSTHPIATDAGDLQTVKLNFDGITYAKGASALRQLVAWVGEEEFFAGLRAYFQKHKWGNTELRDLLVELELTSGRDLSTWTREWLQTAGVNLLRPDVVYADPDTYATVAIVQEPPRMPEGLEPILRSHRIRVGLYDLVEGRLTLTEQVELDVVGARTDLPELADRRASDLMLINDDDLTFAKIRLGGRSSATAIAHLGDLDRPMPRALVWGAAWDMTRDAEWSAGEYLELALSGLPAETDIGVVQTRAVAGPHGDRAVRRPGAPRASTSSAWPRAVHRRLFAAAPGSDHQLAFARALVVVARTPSSSTWSRACSTAPVPSRGSSSTPTCAGPARAPRGIRSGRRRRDRRRARARRHGQRAAQRDRGPVVDPDRAGQGTGLDGRHHRPVRCPTPCSRPRCPAWASPTSARCTDRSATATSRSSASVWDTRSAEMAGMVATALYPGLLVEPETVSRTNDFLADEDLPAGLHRIITEGRDGVERSLRCQARDA